MPTLLEPGKIVEQKWMSAELKNSIKKNRSIDTLIAYIEPYVELVKTTKTKHKSIGEHVLVLKSGTGTGKSTIIPPALYNHFFPNQHKNILITQPTILTTTDIPYQIVSFNKDLVIGKNIGYQTSTLKMPMNRGILFCTVGILLQYLRTMDDETFKKKYGFILIDEVHIRTVDLDMTLYYIKQLLIRNFTQSDCPYVILMSASFDPTPFMNYFECKREQYLEIVGMTYPIEVIYPKYDVSDYLSYIVDKVEQFHLENLDDTKGDNQFRDILVFLQGTGEIKKVEKEIHKLNTLVFSKGLKYSQNHMRSQLLKWDISGGAEPNIYLLPISIMSDNIQKGDDNYKNLFSDIKNVSVRIYDKKELEIIGGDDNGDKFGGDDSDYDSDNEDSGDAIGEILKDGGKVMNKIITVPVSRRVILATNSAETGITIDTLKYCIDSGFAKVNFFDPNYSLDVLIKKNVTQASSMQRKGRVGRKFPGVFIPCYTQETYEKMQKIPFSNIILEDITVFLLGVIVSETNTRIEEVNQSNQSNQNTPFTLSKFDQILHKIVSDNTFEINKHLDFIKQPSADSIKYSMEKLYHLGFIDSNYTPTLFGIYATKFKKLSLESIRMILAGYHHNSCILDLITIIAFMNNSHKLFINRRKYKHRNPLNLNKEENHYYYHYVIADDFIEFLFIWYDVLNIIEKVDKLVDVVEIDDVMKYRTRKEVIISSDDDDSDLKEGRFKKFPILFLKKWCIVNNLDINAILDIVRTRDEIIMDMIAMGLNPYYNGLGISNLNYNLVDILNRNLEEGFTEIAKIKRCMYEGYRMNLCIWSGKEYVNQNSHLPIRFKNAIIMENIKNNAETMPKFLIYDNAMIVDSVDKITINGANIAILDGYVDIDHNFMNF